MNFGRWIALIVSGIAYVSGLYFHAPAATPVADTTTTIAQAPAATTTPAAIKVVATSTRPKVKPPPVSIPPLAPPAATTMQAALDDAASKLRAALVNIICDSNSRLESISGSGVVVDPRGIILTNAHIGQYFLLAADPAQHVSCLIRTGSPATAAYEAELMYISPTWIKNNATVLEEATPTGTGEDDFAFLAISGSASGAPLPSYFPSIPLAKDLTKTYSGEPVVIASYAAQFLTAGQIESSLYPTVTFGSVKQLFTFATDTADLLSLGGSAAAQEGSSGGGIAGTDGTLLALITTSSMQTDTAERDLGALSASYIRHEYLAESGHTLVELGAKQPLAAVAAFAPQIPALEALLTANFPE